MNYEIAMRKEQDAFSDADYARMEHRRILRRVLDLRRDMRWAVKKNEQGLARDLARSVDDAEGECASAFETLLSTRRIYEEARVALIEAMDMHDDCNEAGGGT